MEIAFDTTPDETGKGRVIIDGRYYGLPVEVVREYEFLRRAYPGWKAAALEREEILQKAEKVFADLVLVPNGLITSGAQKPDKSAA